MVLRAAATEPVLEDWRARPCVSRWRLSLAPIAVLCDWPHVAALRNAAASPASLRPSRIAPLLIAAAHMATAFDSLRHRSEAQHDFRCQWRAFTTNHVRTDLTRRRVIRFADNLESPVPGFSGGQFLEPPARLRVSTGCSV